MLDFQLKQTSFRYGLAEGDDPHAVPFGVLSTLNNYVWTKTNRVQKRQGVDFVGAGIIGNPTGVGTLTSAKRLFTRNSERELCLFDGTYLFTCPSGAGTTPWALVGSVPGVGLTWRPLRDPAGGVMASDSAIANGMVVTAVVTGDPTLNSGIPTSGTDIVVTVTDLTTGAILMPPTRMAMVGLGNGVRVIIIGTTAIVVTSGLSAVVKAATVDLTTMTVSATTSLRANRNNVVSQNWDVAPINGSSLFALVYEIGTGGTDLVSYNTAFVQQATAHEASGGAGTIGGLTLCADLSERIYIGYIRTGDVRAYISSSTTMATTVANFLVDGGTTSSSVVSICRYDSTQAAIVYEDSQAPIGFGSSSRLIASAGTLVANTKRTTFGLFPVSCPFVTNGKCYFFASTIPGPNAPAATFTGISCGLYEVFPGPDDGTLPQPNTLHPFAGCADTLLGARSSFYAPLPRFTAVSATLTAGSLPFIGTAPNSNQTWRCGLRFLRVTSGSSLPLDMWRATGRGAEAFISCGVFSVYDGTDLFDYGFPSPPSILTQITAGAGGLILAGNYIYASHQEYRGAGLLYRGPTVVGSALTTAGATSANTLTFGFLNVTNKRRLTGNRNVERAPTLLPLYRTVVNGTIPQRLTFDPSFTTLYVDYLSGNQIIVDTKGDANIDALNTSLASRPALYTSGGTLDDQQPPSSVTGFLHVDRHFLLAGDLTTWWYSKMFNDDAGTAPGFNVAFRILMPTEQTAGVSMDDKAIFFSVNGISYMLGSGPAKDGTASDFTTPIKIQTDVGCTNGRSVVSMPDGIMFLSARGIYLLGRDLALSWIGRPVQDDLVTYPNVTSAVLVPNRNEIRFTANNAAGSLGIVLIYNYVEKQWSTATYYDQHLTHVVGVAIADACMWNGIWTFVTPLGIVYTENSAHNLDVDTYVPGTIETAWNSAGGPIAYQAVSDFWLNGISNTDHDLTIQCAFDSESAYSQSRTFPALSDVTIVSDFEEAKISIGKRRKCNAIRFKVTDAAPTTPGSALGIGKGPTFQVMGFRVGIKLGDKQGAGKKG